MTRALRPLRAVILYISSIGRSIGSRRGAAVGLGFAVSCALACAADDADAVDSSESGDGGGRCVADDDGRGCRCGADVSEIAGWHEVAACDTPPAGEPWTCCDGSGSCGCGVPRCLDFGNGSCRCAAFVETPPDAIAEVASCTALICCDRGDACECSASVLTCTADGAVDECVPPAVGSCGELGEAVDACQVP